MRTLLLAAAALVSAAAVPTFPVQAQQAAATGFTIGSGTSFHDGSGRHDGRFDRRRDRRDDRRFDRRRDRHDDDDAFLYYDREYLGDTAWRSDSFNDWWHDRPDRAYPRWVTNNQNCARQWYGANTLRC